MNGLVNSISSAASLIPKGLEVIVSTVKQIGSKLVEGFSSIPPDMISGFISGLGSGISNIIGVLVDLANTIIETVKGVLGINSPSTKFIEIGKNCIEGLINGLKEGLSGLWDTLKSIGEGIIEVFKSMDFGMAFAAAMGVGLLFTVNKMIDVQYADKPKTVENTFYALGGCNPDTYHETLRQVSPVTYVTPGRALPPFLILHGDADALVLYEDSEDFYNMLVEQGYEADLVHVTNAPHEGNFWSLPLLEIIFDFIQKKLA